MNSERLFAKLWKSQHIITSIAFLITGSLLFIWGSIHHNSTLQVLGLTGYFIAGHFAFEREKHIIAMLVIGCIIGCVLMILGLNTGNSVLMLLAFVALITPMWVRQKLKNSPKKGTEKARSERKG